MKQKSIKISIVTVSYNQVRYLRDNIESVLGQNDPNFEHIIVDACSTDGSVAVLREYPHLRWLSEVDEGQSDGLNKGFAMATGDIIGWINSDDMLFPGALKVVREYFEANPDSLGCVGNMAICNEQGKLIRTVQSEDYEYLDMLTRKRGVTQPSTFLRGSVLSEVGYLDKNLDFIMDFDLYLRVAKKQTIRHVNQTLAIFRLQEAAKTTNGLVEFRKEHISVALKHGASFLSPGIRSDLYVIITEPFRKINWFRNIIRKLKGLEPYDSQKLN